MNMDGNKRSILGCLLVQRKSRLDTIKKAPNSISCKMETFKERAGKQMFGFYFCFLSIEVFGIADFRGHFFHTFLTSSTEEVSEHFWFCSMSV